MDLSPLIGELYNVLIGQNNLYLSVLHIIVPSLHQQRKIPVFTVFSSQSLGNWKY